MAQLIAELAVAGAAALGVTLDAGVEERLLAYARSGAWAGGAGGVGGRRLGGAAHASMWRWPLNTVHP